MIARPRHGLIGKRSTLLIPIFLIAASAQGALTYSTLVIFDGTNGSGPLAPPVQGADGNFYGTTPSGGAFGGGTVFKMAPDGTLTNLFQFGGTNGSRPEAGVIQGLDGRFYGTLQQPNASGGAIFAVSTNATMAIIANLSFTNGLNIGAGLVQGPDGDLYGTAPNGGLTGQAGGYRGYGTVFKVNTNGVVTTLHIFGPTNQFDNTYGTDPMSALVLGTDGNLYGTTSATHQLDGAGTAFRITTNGTFTRLTAFTGGTNVNKTVSPLLQGSDGNFYGASAAGGTSTNFGTVFRLTTNGTVTVLASFNSTNGREGFSCGGLVEGADGNFYGTTCSGGATGGGTVFKVTPDGILTSLYSFSPGAQPTGLTQGSDGNFYGTTLGSGSGNGTVFRVSIPVQPVLQVSAQNDGSLILNWNSAAGQQYQLQFITDLSQTNWNNLGTAIVATNGAMRVSDLPGSDQQRFYRVVLLP